METTTSEEELAVQALRELIQKEKACREDIAAGQTAKVALVAILKEKRRVHDIIFPSHPRKKVIPEKPKRGRPKGSTGQTKADSKKTNTKSTGLPKSRSAPTSQTQTPETPEQSGTETSGANNVFAVSPRADGDYSQTQAYKEATCKTCGLLLKSDDATKKCKCGANIPDPIKPASLPGFE